MGGAHDNERLLFMKLTETNKVYFISIGIFLCDIILNIILYVLVQMGVHINIPISLNVILSESLILIPAVLYLLLQKKNPLKVIPHKTLKVSVILLLIVFTWLITPLIMVINAISMLFVENAMTGAINEVTDYPFWAGVTLLALIPALVEEFVCRGVIFHGLRHNGIWKAILISALLFGIMHMNFNQMSYAFVLGIVLALVVEATDSIWASVIVHFTFNASSVALNYLMNIFAPEAVEESANLFQSGANYYVSMLMVIISYAMLAVFTTSIAVGVFYLIAKLCNRDWCMKLLFTGKTGPYPKKERTVTPVLIGFLVFSIAFITLLT